MNVFDCVKEGNKLASLDQHFSLDWSRTINILSTWLILFSDSERLKREGGPVWCQNSSQFGFSICVCDCVGINICHTHPCIHRFVHSLVKSHLDI